VRWRLGTPLALSVAALLGASSAQGLPAAGPGYVASFQIAYDSPPFPDTRYHMTVSITGDVCGDPFDNPWLFEAVFRLVRLREPSDMIGMRLVEGSFNTCRKSAGPNRAALPVRRLWVRGSGKFQTMGRYATATRGNWWLTADFCDRSLVHARQGSVLVTDFVTKKKVVVKAPKSYTARREAR
jgi:hypothetical protein